MTQTITFYIQLHTDAHSFKILWWKNRVGLWVQLRCWSWERLTQLHGRNNWFMALGFYEILRLNSPPDLSPEANWTPMHRQMVRNTLCHIISSKYYSHKSLWWPKLDGPLPMGSPRPAQTEASEGLPCQICSISFLAVYEHGELSIKCGGWLILKLICHFEMIVRNPRQYKNNM